MSQTPEADSANSAKSATDRLDSWKEIAAHLKRGVTTVQRWEREEGLPVHRLPHRKQGSVFAHSSEIDAWWTQRQESLQKATETEDAPGSQAVPRAASRSWIPVVLAFVGFGALAAAFVLWKHPAAEAITCRHAVALGADRITSLEPDGDGVIAVIHQPAGGGRWGVFRIPLQAFSSGQALQTTELYRGDAHVERVAVFRGSLFSVLYSPGREEPWAIYRSPDGQNLGGGGSSVLAYRGRLQVDALTPFQGGVLTSLYDSGDASPSHIYLSGDGNNLVGGGATLRVYSGGLRVDTMVPYAGGVITALYDPQSRAGRGISFSPDGRNPADISGALKVYSREARSEALVVSGDGIVYTAFYNPSERDSWGVYRSPDGRDLAGGGAGKSNLVYSGPFRVDAMLPYRNGVITAFRHSLQGHPMGVRYSQDGFLVGGGGNTNRVYDGPYRVAAMIRFGAGVLTAMADPNDGSGTGLYYSPDGNKLDAMRLIVRD